MRLSRYLAVQAFPKNRLSDSSASSTPIDTISAALLPTEIQLHDTVGRAGARDSQPLINRILAELRVGAYISRELRP